MSNWQFPTWQYGYTQMPNYNYFGERGGYGAPARGYGAPRGGGRGRGYSKVRHRSNMESDLQSLFGLHVLRCIHWLRPRNFSPPPHSGSYTRALLVSQDRQHLFGTPWGAVMLENKRKNYQCCELESWWVLVVSVGLDPVRQKITKNG